MTIAEVVPQVSADEARVLTDQIKVAVETSWHLIVRAYQTGAHLALGYKSWDDYTTREFGTARLRLPKEERQEVVSSLRDSGLSIRAIASATGINRETVAKELQMAGNQPPAKPLARTTVQPNFKPGTVKGTDGKTYPSKADKPKTTPSRKPLTDAVDSAGWELRRSAERVQRLSEDDRWAAQKEKVAGQLTSHLRYVVGICEEILDNLGA